MLAIFEAVARQDDVGVAIKAARVNKKELKAVFRSRGILYKSKAKPVFS
jgi:hypothetical protein